MTVNCLTLFPEMFSGFLNSSIALRAHTAGLLDVNCIDFRTYSRDRHHRVDDYPFGGDPGMLLCAQPLFDCFRDLSRMDVAGASLNVYMSPSGRPLTSELARSLAQNVQTLNVLCGHYEGVDQRVLDAFIDMEISIGDYILTGGELPALVLIDCVMRHIPGVLSNAASADSESFADGLLEYPQYTRPRVYEGLEVPDVLLSGHHANIADWRRRKSLEKTMHMRPDLLPGAQLSESDKRYLAKLKQKGELTHEQCD